MRRIVTGHDAAGKAVFLEDGPAPNRITLDGRPGWELNTLWATPAVPAVPWREGDPSLAVTSYLPDSGATRFIFAVWPGRGDQARNAPPAELRAEYNAKVPGLGQAHEQEAHGMHTTDTVDYVIILQGEVWLELDDGQQRCIRAGDCVVQNGTRHRWQNRAELPCVMAAVMVGATRQA